jgi:hypothetical protein
MVRKSGVEMNRVDGSVFDVGSLALVGCNDEVGGAGGWPKP